MVKGTPPAACENLPLGNLAISCRRCFDCGYAATSQRQSLGDAGCFLPTTLSALQAGALPIGSDNTALGLERCNRYRKGSALGASFKITGPINSAQNLVASSSLSFDGVALTLIFCWGTIPCRRRAVMPTHFVVDRRALQNENAALRRGAPIPALREKSRQRDPFRD